MKPLAQKVWTEPAAFIATLVLILTVAQTLVVDNQAVSAVIAAVLVALGGAATRSRVTPVPKGTPNES